MDNSDGQKYLNDQLSQLRIKTEKLEEKLERMDTKISAMEIDQKLQAYQNATHREKIDEIISQYDELQKAIKEQNTTIISRLDNVQYADKANKWDSVVWIIISGVVGFIVAFAMNGLFNP